MVDPKTFWDDVVFPPKTLLPLRCPTLACLLLEITVTLVLVQQLLAMPLCPVSPLATRHADDEPSCTHVFV